MESTISSEKMFQLIGMKEVELFVVREQLQFLADENKKLKDQLEGGVKGNKKNG